MGVVVSGNAKPGFENVAEAFAASFAGLPSMGAALAIRVEGETVVDLWGGVADERDGRRWAHDTASVIFSCTKGLVSILAARLVEEGRLDYQAPVAVYWPEFAQAGKAEMTVAEALSHRVGLSAPRVDLSFEDLLDWGRMVEVLEAQEPLWPRGSGYVYHTLTHGWVAGEIVRRAAGKSVGAYFAELIARPLNADAWIGYPEDAPPPTHLQVSPLLADLWAEDSRQPAPNWPHRAMTMGGALPPALVTADGAFNDRRLLRAEVPGAGGVATAAALAEIWSATVAKTEGVRLLSDSVITEATVPQSAGAPVFPAEPPYSAWGMGFQLDSEARRYLSPRSFGHDGAGGQVGFADPEYRVGFGYVTNWMMGPEDTRSKAIIDALRAAIAR